MFSLSLSLSRPLSLFLSFSPSRVMTTSLTLLGKTRCTEFVRAPLTASLVFYVACVSPPERARLPLVFFVN